MKHNYKLILLLLTLLPFAGAAQSLLLVSRDDNGLRDANPSSYSINSTTNLTTSSTIDGLTGLAIEPCSGRIYGVIKLSSTSTRYLGEISGSGSVDLIGSLSDAIASIAFDGNGTLYGVTGDGASNPEQLYTIDTSSAVMTYATTLGNGNDGECIAYNPDDGFMYHWSGYSTNVFEKINLSSYVVTNIPFTNTNVSTEEVFCATYIGAGQFLIGNIDDSLFTITSGGYAQSTGIELSFTPKGLAMTENVLISGTANEFCPGDSVTMNASGGSTFQWYRNGLPVSSATNPTLVVYQGGHYNCVVTNSICSDSSETGFDVEALNAPVVTITADTTEFCQGDSVNLTGSSGGTSQWYLNGSAINGANTASYEAYDEGWYNMIKTNTNGCSDSAAAGVYLTQHSAPEIDLGADKDICEGDSIELNAGSLLNATYTWSTGSGDSAIFVSQQATYAVTVVGSNGCEGSDEIDVEVHAMPVVDLGPDTSFCAGGSLTLNPGSSAGSTYLWSTGNISQTLVVSTAAIYKVTVTSAFGCVNSDQVTVQVNALPVVDLGSDKTLCIDEKIIIDAGSGFDSYLWNTGSTVQNFEVSSGQVGSITFRVTVTDANGCTGSDTIEISWDDCTGIEGISEDSQLSIFPNPSTGHFTVIDGLGSQIIIRDITGRVVESRSVSNSGRLEIELGSPGIYFVESRRNDVLLTTRKVIVE